MYKGKVKKRFIMPCLWSAQIRLHNAFSRRLKVYIFAPPPPMRYVGSRILQLYKLLSKHLLLRLHFEVNKSNRQYKLKNVTISVASPLDATHPPVDW